MSGVAHLQGVFGGGGGGRFPVIDNITCQIDAQSKSNWWQNCLEIKSPKLWGRTLTTAAEAVKFDAACTTPQTAQTGLSVPVFGRAAQAPPQRTWLKQAEELTA